MSVNKPAIPQAPKPGYERQRFDNSLKETIEIITGARGEKIAPLNANASLSDVIAKVNEILGVLQ